MRLRNRVSWVWGVLACTALVAGPAAWAADTASPVTCKDGTSSPHGGRGACSGHGGIDKAATAAAKGSSGATTSSGGASSSGSSGGAASPSGSAAGGAAAPAPGASTSTHPPSTQTATPKAPPADKAPAPGGGPGMVWVNSASKVYHCPSDRWYGKTKAGEYMTESAAKAAGNHADRGKACS